MMETYKWLFGVLPKQTYRSPLEPRDHPELDTSEELRAEGIKIYQLMIGATQWAISLGRFNIATAVMTLSSFRAAPRQGHLEQIQRVYRYLSKMKHGAICFWTDIPDYSAVPIPDYDWASSTYGNVEELIPDDMPEPLGKLVQTSTFFDANLCHDMTTGKSVTGILHPLNQTPIDYFSKKQPLVETATYGSEFMSARQATEQVMDIQNTLQYLGVPVITKLYMFGDNKTVCDSATKPTAKLNKRHAILSYHRVREAVAAGIIALLNIPGKNNPAYILSKAWKYSSLWRMLKALLFWEGDTSDIASEDD